MLQSFKIGITYRFRIIFYVESVSGIRLPKEGKVKNYTEKYLEIIYADSEKFVGIDEKGIKYCYNVSDFLTRTIKF